MDSNLERINFPVKTPTREDLPFSVIENIGRFSNWFGKTSLFETIPKRSQAYRCIRSGLWIAFLHWNLESRFVLSGRNGGCTISGRNCESPNFFLLPQISTWISGLSWNNLLPEILLSSLTHWCRSFRKRFPTSYGRICINSLNRADGIPFTTFTPSCRGNCSFFVSKEILLLASWAIY